MSTVCPSNLTGIPSVDSFLANAPSLFTPDEETGSPTCFGFKQDGGVDVIKVLSQEEDRDDAMDAVANGIIAYAKSFHPIAVVVITEGFQQTVNNGNRPLPPVDCARFKVDLEYRDQILGERKETFMAFVETSGGTHIIAWKIERENGTRRLGDFVDAGPGARGRFANLLHKEHAADVMVEVVKPGDEQKVAFAPETVESLRERFSGAMEGDPHSAGHVFDLEGIRLIIAPFDNDRIAVIAVNYDKPMVLSEFRPLAIEAFNSISGYDVTESHIRDRMTKLCHVGAWSFSVDLQPAEVRQG